MYLKKTIIKYNFNCKKLNPRVFTFSLLSIPMNNLTLFQRYTNRVLQTIQMKLILLWVWAEQAVLGRAKTALKFKYEI